MRKWLGGFDWMFIAVWAVLVGFSLLIWAMLTIFVAAIWTGLTS